MGACLSCTWSQSDEFAHNEQTPLLHNENTSLQPSGNASTEMDKLRREQQLSNIVDFTGRNLIDLMSVQRPETQTIGKSAEDYIKLLKSVEPQSVNGSWPRKKLERKSNEENEWLRQLAHEANEAIENEPGVTTNERLVADFS